MSFLLSNIYGEAIKQALWAGKGQATTTNNKPNGNQVQSTKKSMSAAENIPEILAARSFEASDPVFKDFIKRFFEYLHKNEKKTFPTPNPDEPNNPDDPYYDYFQIFKTIKRTVKEKHGLTKIQPGTYYKDCTFGDIDLENNTIENVCFEECSFRGCDLPVGIKLKNCIFKNTRINSLRPESMDKAYFHGGAVGEFKFFWGMGDKELAYIRDLIGLEKLYLGDTRVSNEGMSHLSGLLNLQELNLDRTQVGNEGMRYLWGLSNLQSLNLGGTQVSNEGLLQLRSALSNLKRLYYHKLI